MFLPRGTEYSIATPLLLCRSNAIPVSLLQYILKSTVPSTVLVPRYFWKKYRVPVPRYFLQPIPIPRYFYFVPRPSLALRFCCLNAQYYWIYATAKDTVRCFIVHLENKFTAS